MIPIRDNVPSSNVPMAMWSIIGINALVYFGEASLSEQQLVALISEYGVVPARFSPTLQIGAVATLLTNTFLHGGLLHLLGNMWTLYLFGDNVEDRMGPIRFVIFYLACGLIASLTHVWTNPGSEIPAVGASGAIAGVMGAYVLMYPRAGIVLLVPILFLPFFFQISAWVYFGGWFLMQYFSATMSASEAGMGGGIAFWAHIGGFVAGIALHRLFLRRKTHPPHLEPDEIPFENAWRR